MPLRNIRKNGDPVLRKKAAPVTRFTPGLFRLLEDMKETMIDADGGGLAAPQIGLSKRIIVCRNEDEILELINPVIVSSKGTVVEIEGCLSFPGLYGEVPRAERVLVTGQNREGKQLKLDAEGFLARVLQHEIDHLEGILFVDRASHLLTPDELQEIIEKRQ